MLGTSHRSLWPREHGAYAQLAIPLVTAHALHRPTIAMLGLTAAAALTFLANEPLLVVLGHRGPRRRAHDGERAQRHLAILTGAAIAAGGGGLVLAPRDAALASLLLAIPVLAVVVVIWRRATRTVGGELVASIALTGASVPVLVAGGATPGAALSLWAAWALGFAAAVLAVHRVISRHRAPASTIDHVLAFAFVATVFACSCVAWRAAVVAAPLVAMGALLVVAPPPATRLRVVGVASVVVAAGSATLAAVAGVA